MINSNGCEDFLCEALDELLKEKKKYIGFKILSMVAPTFSKIDHYICLFSEIPAIKGFPQ